MNSIDIQSLLYKHKAELNTIFGVSNIGLFGSFARNEGTDKSDIDIAVELDSPDLFLLSALKIYLESLLRREVDVVRIRKNMNQFLKKRISDDILYV
ncbi:MAG: nucleotidyltransferase domain-containing protein [Ignavibacteria bacterium]|jgi:hypothetical protein|nr:nucleotidyltransferase domain-containing protein [Ignavibacteria bacterium]